MCINLHTYHPKLNPGPWEAAEIWCNSMLQACQLAKVGNSCRNKVKEVMIEKDTCQHCEPEKTRRILVDVTLERYQ